MIYANFNKKTCTYLNIGASGCKVGPAVRRTASRSSCTTKPPGHVPNLTSHSSPLTCLVQVSAGVPRVAQIKVGWPEVAQTRASSWNIDNLKQRNNVDGQRKTIYMHIHVREMIWLVLIQNEKYELTCRSWMHFLIVEKSLANRKSGRRDFTFTACFSKSDWRFKETV